jgi:hypothetical protein
MGQIRSDGALLSVTAVPAVSSNKPAANDSDSIRAKDAAVLLEA